MARKLMGANPESRQAEGKNEPAKSEITKPLTATLSNPSPQARNNEGFDTVEAVDRKLPSSSPEAARQRNNRSRDSRTNLGRGIPANVVIG